MSTEIPPPTQTSIKKKRYMPTLLVIFILIAVGLGYYAWRQQQNALAGLKRLENNGVNVTFYIRSRPLLVIDSTQQMLFLISGSNPKQPKKLPFQAIRKITFKETNLPYQDTSEPTGPDTLLIEMSSGETHRIGDLPGREDGARQALQKFEQYGILTDQLTLKSR